MGGCMSNWEMNQLQNDEQAISWLVKDYWSLAEGLALLGRVDDEGVGSRFEMVGKSANPKPAPPFFIGNTGETYSKIIRAIKAKSLKQIKPRPEEYPVYRPHDFIQFAIDKRIGDWKYWRALLKANPIPVKAKDWKKRPFKDFEAEKDQYRSFSECAKMYSVSRTTYSEFYKLAQARVATGRIIKQK